MDKLILKYLQNNLSLQEQHQLLKWLDEDDHNKEVLRMVEIYWKDHSHDLEEEEQKVKTRLAKRIDEYKRNHHHTSGFTYNLIKIAATIVLVLVSVLAAINLSEVKEDAVKKPISFVEKKSLPGEKVTIQLPDGSSVKLNSGSKIIYPDSFTGEIREVFLEGEGFFDVEKDATKPFIVIANKAMIKVLGTSFNINSLKSSNKVVVSVRSGQVKVSNQSENVSRILNPDELVIFNNSNELMEFRKINDQELIFGWTNHLLVFNDNQINEILNTLSNWYGIEFILNRNIDNKRVFTSKFENPTLKSVLESLSYVYDFKYEINEKTVIIK